MDKKAVIQWAVLAALLLLLVYVVRTVLFPESETAPTEGAADEAAQLSQLAPPTLSVAGPNAGLDAGEDPDADAPSGAGPPDLPSDTLALAELAKQTTDIVQLARIQQILRYRESINAQISETLAGSGGGVQNPSPRLAPPPSRGTASGPGPGSDLCRPDIAILHLSLNEGAERAIVRYRPAGPDGAPADQRFQLSVGGSIGHYRVESIDRHGLELSTDFCPQPINVLSGW